MGGGSPLEETSPGIAENQNFLIIITKKKKEKKTNTGWHQKTTIFGWKEGYVDRRISIDFWP